MCAIRPSPFLSSCHVFLPALPWLPERVSNAPVGLLMLRLPSLGWVFLTSSLCLRFSFYLGPWSPVYLLVATQGLAAYSCFTMQSFWYSLLAQLSASISSLVVSLYSEFMSTFVPPLHLQCWRTWFLFFEFGTQF